MGTHPLMPPKGESVSVVMCCHNSATRLPETLRHLANQDVPRDTSWEILVVDNASTDATASVAKETWSRLGANAPLRVVSQPRPGVVWAREKGIAEAAHDVVVFCDDDNWLAPDYVRTVLDVMIAHPEVGAVGGWGAPVFDAEPPAWFDAYPQYFATGPQAEATGDVTDTKGYVYGAGMAVRRHMVLAVRATGLESSLRHMVHGSNDIELCYWVRLAGGRVRYDERLRFEHFMPGGRLRWGRFLDLVENAHRTGVYVRPYLHVLRAARDDEGYTRPGGTYWLGRCAQLIPTWCVQALVTLKNAGLDAPRSAIRARRARGELIGWLEVRDRYAASCDRIEGARRRLLQGRPR